MALRVLVEKIGLPGVDVGSLSLSRQGRASYCNAHWQGENQKVTFMCLLDGRREPKKGGNGLERRAKALEIMRKPQRGISMTGDA